MRLWFFLFVFVSVSAEATFYSWGFNLENSEKNPSKAFPKYRWPLMTPPRGYVVSDEDFDKITNSPEFYAEIACETLGENHRLLSMMDLTPSAATPGLLPNVFSTNDREYIHASFYENREVGGELIYPNLTETILDPNNPSITITKDKYGTFLLPQRGTGGIFNEWLSLPFNNSLDHILLAEPVFTNINETSPLPMLNSLRAVIQMPLSSSSTGFMASGRIKLYDPVEQMKGWDNGINNYAPSVYCIKELE